MVIVFSATLFLSAALLFTIQPLVAKMLLPRLGGSPAVWGACMVFFQAGLLAGYVYSHFLTTWMKERLQIIVHVCVLLLPLTVLPLGLPPGSIPEAEGSPVAWLLGTLVATAGLPFFVLATTAPLVQRWFSATDHPDAKDPYFLYAASNLGSLAGLVLYPFLLEPFLRLNVPGTFLFLPRLDPPSQSGVWTLGYVLFVVLVGTCGLRMLARISDIRSRAKAEDPEIQGTAVGWRRRVRWVLLSLAPVGVMLGATQYLTAEIAAVPLLWIVPLALYLGTYVVAFSRRLRVPLRASSVALAILTLGIAAGFMVDSPQPPWIAFPMHLAAVAAAGLACHGRLAADRPGPARLTEYYLLVATGGVLGGAFSALVAPWMFDGMAEYLLLLLLACLLRSSLVGEDAPKRSALRERVLDVVVPGAVVLAAVAVRFVLIRVQFNAAATTVFDVGIPAALCLGLVASRRRFALALAGLLAFGWVAPRSPSQVLFRERTFFGIHRVTEELGRAVPIADSEGREALVALPFRFLFHGSTRHGAECLDPMMKGKPTAYYHPTGPIGRLFAELDRSPTPRTVAVVGLGSGGLASYGRPGDAFTFYEIDPEVVRIARDTRLFSYLPESRADVRIVLGDGRLGIAGAEDASYDLVVIDAFSSDSIPVHLLTREAVEIYVRKLRPGGILVMHLSNRYLDLGPVVGSIAADLGLNAWLAMDTSGSAKDLVEGKERSRWAFLGRERGVLAAEASKGDWATLREDLPLNERARDLWTDDYSNILRLLRFW